MGARTDSALLSSVGHGQQLGLVLRALAVRCRVQGWGRLSLVLCEEQLACMWTGGQGPRGFPADQSQARCHQPCARSGSGWRKTDLRGV